MAANTYLFWSISPTTSDAVDTLDGLSDTSSEAKALIDEKDVMSTDEWQVRARGFFLGATYVLLDGFYADYQDASDVPEELKVRAAQIDDRAEDIQIANMTGQQLLVNGLGDFAEYGIPAAQRTADLFDEMDDVDLLNVCESFLD